MNALGLALPVICLVTSRHALAPDARTIDAEIAAMEAVSYTHLTLPTILRV